VLVAAACVSVAPVGSAGAERSRHQAGKGTVVYRLAGEDPQVFPEGVAVERPSDSFFVSASEAELSNDAFASPGDLPFTVSSIKQP
jgi:hypothetical protein